MRNERKSDAPLRTVTEIGAGDFIKVGSEWKRVVSNSDAGAQRAQRDGNWRIRTEGGATYTGWNINAYAKAEDMKS